jgi:predicted transcriptional regulator
MTTLVIDIANQEDIMTEMNAAFNGEPQGCSYSFLSEEALLATLTLERWTIMKALIGAGPLAINELAKRLGRDVTDIQEDVRLLVRCGLIDRTHDDLLHLPYDEVSVGWSWKAVA